MIKQAIGRVQTASKKVTNREMDALDLLRSDHMKVEALLLQLRFRKDALAREKLLREIKSNLWKHMRIEEEIFYPACNQVDKLKPLVKDSFEEHDELRDMFNDLSDLEPSSTQFSKKVTSIIQHIEHHVRDEENKIFPTVRKLMDKKRFSKMNREVIEAHSTPKGMLKHTKKAA